MIFYILSEYGGFLPRCYQLLSDLCLKMSQLFALFLLA